MTQSLTLDTLFNSYVEVPKLTEEQEHEAITGALAGESEPTTLLLAAYAPALKAAIKKAPWTADKEELQSAVLMGFMVALNAFDPDKHRRLAATLKDSVLAEVSGISDSASGFTIPQRTLSRFFHILRAANGNVYDALAIVSDHSMTTETFLTIYAALRDVSSIDERLDAGDIDGAWKLIDGPLQASGEINEGDLELIKMIFEERDDEHDLNRRELEVVTTTYGFNDYSSQTKTDDEVAEIRGLTRSTTKRVRTSALNKCRGRLGIAA